MRALFRCLIARPLAQRCATLVPSADLNNVTSESDLSVGGGQTNFPRAATAEYPDGGPLVHDYFDCSRGLSVYPQEGKVIIFYSMLPNGEMDDFSLHGGCDVLDQTATKWSANFWWACTAVQLGPSK